MMSSAEPQISAAFPFESRYVEVHGSRIHYVDEGDGDPVLFLHGNPTSCYLWRNVIPHVTPVARAIAPDLIGMGRSDRPDIRYRFFDHARYVDGFIDALGIEDLTLVIHDWGSALGFHYARRHEHKVRGIAFMEAILRPVTWRDFPGGYRAAFKLFRTPVLGWLLISVLNVFVRRVLPGATARKLGDEEMAHYVAPFPTIASRRPVRQWPCEIPIEGRPEDVHEAVAAYHRWLQETELPKLFFYARPGALCPRPVVEWAQGACKNLKTVDIGRGLHYIQEDDPQTIGTELAAWIRSARR